MTALMIIGGLVALELFSAVVVYVLLKLGVLEGNHHED